MVFKVPCQFLLLFGVGGLRHFKEIIKLKISLRWDRSEDCVFTSQRPGASFPPNTKSSGVTAEGDTFSHFVAWTADRFGGAWAPRECPVFTHCCDHTVQEALLGAKHKSKMWRHLHTLEINVRTSRCRLGVLIWFRRPGSKPAICLSDVCSSLARLLCYLEENGQCSEHISPCSSWVSRGSREYI